MLCFGAGTASLLNEKESEQPNTTNTDFSVVTPNQQIESQMRRPLFCDPDRVLDIETLRNVAVKLRVFAEKFASIDVMEGGDFGTTADDMPIYEENNGDVPHPSPGPLPKDNPNRNLSAQNGERKPRGSAPTAQRLYADSVGGIFSTTHRDTTAKKKDSVEENKIEVAVALVQKVSEECTRCFHTLFHLQVAILYYHLTTFSFSFQRSTFQQFYVQIHTFSILIRCVHFMHMMSVLAYMSNHVLTYLAYLSSQKILG